MVPAKKKSESVPWSKATRRGRTFTFFTLEMFEARPNGCGETMVVCPNYHKFIVLLLQLTQGDN